MPLFALSKHSKTPTVFPNIVRQSLFQISSVLDYYRLLAAREKSEKEKKRLNRRGRGYLHLSVSLAVLLFALHHWPLHLKNSYSHRKVNVFYGAKNPRNEPCIWS